MHLAEINSPEINPEQFPDPSAESYLYNGATAVEEWENMPSMDTLDAATKLDPSELSKPIEPQLLILSKPEASKEAYKEGLSSLSRVVGSLALGSDVIMQKIGNGVDRGMRRLGNRFRQAAETFRNWRSKEDTPVDTEPAKLDAKSYDTTEIVAAADAAKAKGDWAEYQRQVLKFAEVTDKAQEVGLLDEKAVDIRTGRADAKIHDTVIDSANLAKTSLVEHERRTEATKKAAERARDADWLNPVEILELRKQIDKAVEDAVAGDYMAFDDAQIARTRTEKMRELLGNYYGVKPGLINKEVPKHVREGVNKMLSMPLEDLSDISLKVLRKEAEAADRIRAAKAAEKAALEAAQSKAQAKAAEIAQLKPIVSPKRIDNKTLRKNLNMGFKDRRRYQKIKDAAEIEHAQALLDRKEEILRINAA